MSLETSASKVPWGESQILDGVFLSHTPAFSAVRFDAARQALSSAVFNGGWCRAASVLNLCVPKVQTSAELEEPAVSLQRAAERATLPGPTVGMMTAASMKSLRVAQSSLQGEELLVLATAGLENARRAGDVAEYRELARRPKTIGTINMTIFCSAALAPAAMVEMVMVATESKSAVLQDLGVASAISSGVATGTGTDAVVVISGERGRPLQYAGKHTLLGEQLARLVMAALGQSISWKEADSS